MTWQKYGNGIEYGIQVVERERKSLVRLKIETVIVTVSENPMTGERCIIPDALDDSRAIEQFLFKNQGKKVVVVQGLGFVGAVMSLVCANAITETYAVIGVDLPSKFT